MIRIQGKEGRETGNTVHFEPRSGFKVPSRKYNLIYGHVCPHCTNVIQALFEVNRPFSLWPYEETKILSQGTKNSGEFLKTFPEEKTKQNKSCYRYEFSPANNGSVKLILRNHVMNNSVLVTKLFDGNGIWEVGFERPCIKAGLTAIREDLLVKDWLLFSQAQLKPDELNKYNLPKKVGDIIPKADTNFKVINAIGVGSPMILINKDDFLFGYAMHADLLARPFVKSTRK